MVRTKVERVHQKQTVDALNRLLGVVGLDHHGKLKSSMLMRRIDERLALPNSEITTFLEPGELLAGIDQPA